MNKTVTPKRLVVALLAAGVLAGTTSFAYGLGHDRGTAASSALIAAADAPGAAALAPIPAEAIATAGTASTAAISGVALPDFSVITERYGPAVVNISVTGTTKTAAIVGSQRGDPFGNDPFFEFFRRFQGGGQLQEREVPTRGQGSGFIVSADGIILTNAHVVRDAKEVTVKLTDRREFKAKVLGSDPKTDVAVLKIAASNLPVVVFGKTSDLKVGEWVLAIGSPYGFENSVSAGVVSAKGRALPDDSFVPFIQTDVAVNPGNSGGPLFNARGEVVGINSQIFSQTGGYQGLSFAIPIDVAARIKDQIVATGKVAHARLGVTVQEVNQSLADSFKLDKPEGALIANVEAGGPAEKAGLKSGDVIRSINGKPIVASGDLPAFVGLAKPGDKVVLDVWRDGKRTEVNATLADSGERGERAAKDDQASGKARLGLSLRPLQPQEMREAGTTGRLLIEDATGPAAQAGVESGDILLAVNGKPVTSIEQVREIVAKSDKSVALLIQRGEDKLFVPVRLI